MNINNYIFHSLVFIYCVTNVQPTKFVKFTIAHTGDLNSRYIESRVGGGYCRPNDECEGGLCRINHYIEKVLKKERTDVYLVNTGNTVGGGSYSFSCNSSLYHEMSAYFSAKTYSAIGVNEIFYLGNDLGNYLSLSKSMLFACSNLKWKKGKDFNAYQHLVPPTRIDMIDGVGIAFIGFTASSVLIAEKTDIEFTNEFKSIDKEVKNARHNHKIEIIIIYGHASKQESIKILQEVGHIDIIISSGITNDYSEEMVEYPLEVELKKGRRAILMRTFGYGETVGVCDVEFNPVGKLVKYVGKTIKLDSTIGNTEACVSKFKRLCKISDVTYIKTEIGKVNYVLDSNHKYPCFLGECNIGNLLADSIVYSLSIKDRWSHWAERTVAVVSSYLITNNINTTATNFNVSITDLKMAILDDPMNLISIEILGKDFVAFLEESVNRNGGPEFLQVSGLQVVYDYINEPGNRIVSLKVRCGTCIERRFVPVKLNETYTIVMPQKMYLDGHYLSLKKPRKTVDLLLRVERLNLPMPHDLEKDEECPNEHPSKIDYGTLFNIVELYLKSPQYKRAFIENRIVILNPTGSAIFTKFYVKIYVISLMILFI